ncbi:MAG: hypothetical protein WBF56_05910 [Candidatus Acidiferrales bacterium]
MSRSTPPAFNEFELSILGPGRGECVIIHVGDNQWCIVDSCISRGLSESVAVDYLNGFNNNALNGVRLVVATHWHDDHIRGLASVLRRVPTASFFCSMAINSDNFFALAETATTAMQRNSGVEEFSEILGLIAENAPQRQPKRLASPKWVLENRRLLRLDQGDRPFPVSITALSPSDGTVKAAIAELAKLFPKSGESQRRIPSRSLNHTSIVLWIEAGPLRAMLGADLENTGNEGEGWVAVLQCHSDRQEQIAACFFKVPHHGSSNADHPDVWTHMLAPNPIAVVTPFNGGAKRLPQPSDLERLQARTSNLYCTTAGAGKPPARDAVVEKMMKLQAVSRRVVEGQPGQVRVRWTLRDQQTEPTVELFHGAYRA